jgi:hypothetical protein
VTWTSNSIPLPAAGIACSTNGAKVYAFLNIGDPDSGFTGYVLTPQEAPLYITTAGTNVVLSWPTNYFASFMLEQNADVVATNWVEVATPAKIVGDYWQVTNGTAGEKKFFRLKSQAQ